MIYWRRYGGDYLVSTQGFTMEMDGAYGRLLDAYYEREGPLPIDEVMEIARATTETQAESVRKVLDRKFKKRSDGYHHDRADAEIALALQARENGGKHVGKSGKKTRTRSGRPTETITGERTDTATGEITNKRTGTASQGASQNAQESTVQPSTSQPSAVQPSIPPAGGEQPQQEPPRPKRARRAAASAPQPEPPAQQPPAEAPPVEDVVDHEPGEHFAGASDDEIPWWHSWQGISGMALERGITVIPGQPHQDFVARVFAAVGPGRWDSELPPPVRERVEYFRATGGLT